MPVNPLDNVPEGLRNRTVAMNKLTCNSKEPEMNGHLIVGGLKVFASNRHSETTSSYNYTNWLIEQGDANHTESSGHLTSDNMVRAQQASFRQPCMMKHNQAKEADIQACSEKTVLPDQKLKAYLDRLEWKLASQDIYKPTNMLGWNATEESTQGPTEST